jgi:hypothetical protein
MTDSNAMIDAFIEGLRRRPWLELDWIAVIDHGLRMAACDPDRFLWERLREVIHDDDDLTMADQLARISEITAARRVTRPHAN